MSPSCVKRWFYYFHCMDTLFSSEISYMLLIHQINYFWLSSRFFQIKIWVLIHIDRCTFKKHLKLVIQTMQCYGIFLLVYLNQKISKSISNHFILHFIKYTYHTQIEILSSITQAVGKASLYSWYHNLWFLTFRKLRDIVI